ncbi:MAG: hypothetical protein B6D63_01260 [Candidatus Latescibacteria bacterium 4484_7]|nr:MAG: hypothetical protein B6D63_01260 [Candidatus Latescibacteria bacterium 4484_7]
MKAIKRVPSKTWKVLWGLVACLLLFSSVWAQGVDTKKAGKSGATLREKKYYYRAFNRRDPFQSLIVGEYSENQLDLIDIYKVRLVGVLTGGYQKLAMLEDQNGYGYILKAGDRIKNGKIVSVGDRSLIARVTVFGQTNTITLRLEDSNKKGV